MAHGAGCVPTARGHTGKHLCPTRIDGQWHCRRSWNGFEAGSHAGVVER